MNSARSPSDPPASGGRSSAEHIRDAALSKFAAQGTASTSLRAVAAAAGVSLGRVQHHFGTKARLIQAVDEYVLAVLREQLPRSIPPPSADPIGDFGNHVLGLIADYPDVLDYFARALVEGSEFGSVVFDDLVSRGEARWVKLKQEQIARPDIDVTWAAINPIILTMGVILMRTQIERQLPESLTSPTQLQRWGRAVGILMRYGQLRRPPSDNNSAD